MEPHQRDIIQKNQTKLLEETICSEIFLSMFSSRDILNKEDLENIKAQGINYGNIKKSKEFYSIIVTRTNAYNVLLEALHVTKQTGVLAVLNQDPKSPSTAPKAQKILQFMDSPNYIAEFLNQISTNFMIVSSLDCKITCDRILETTPRTCHFTPKGLVEFISTTEGRVSTSNLSVVNCGEEVASVFRYVHKITAKVVLITSISIDELKKNYSEPKKLNVSPYLVQDNIDWDDLSPNYQDELKKIINNQLKIDENDTVLEDEDIDTESLISIINGKPLKFLRDTLPEEIIYYIPRRIINRRIVSQDIFKNGGQDIYLFENIERHKLTELANGLGTEISSVLINTTNYISSQFVILENSHHFEQISKKYDDRPVHVLSFNDKNLLWKKSSGSIHNIQTSLLTEQTIQQENDFMKDVTSSSLNARFPICISDTPGMGKSILLAHFSRLLMRESNDQIVGFVVISELVKVTKERMKKSSLTKEILLLALANYLSRNKLGEIFLKIHTNEIKELLFDGFDELNSEDIPLGYKILRIIRSEFQEARIWVTTRPHMFLELEKVLLVLGSNIQSFSELDQINFLESFWCRHCTQSGETDLKSQKLRHFARSCISSLKSTVNNREEDIAGIPLQCMLIGEVFETEAMDFIREEDCQIDKLSENPQITSMVDLYDKLIKNKIDKFHLRYSNKEVSYSQLIKVHTYLSVLLLFPTLRRTFKDVLCPQNFFTAVQQIFDVGILESRSILPAPRFIHRTFAEYFVAKFIVETLTAGCDMNVLDFVHSHVLKTISCTFRIRQSAFTTRDFKHNVVCYFIDALLARQPELKINENIIPPKNDLLLFKTTEACVYNDFYHVYLSFMHNFVTKDGNKRDVFNGRFLKLVVLRSNSLMFQIAFQNVTSLGDVTITDITENDYTLLHLAVIRGNYKLVELLLEKANFKELILKDDTKFWTILHECVQDTHRSNFQTINDKASIIKYLTGLNTKVIGYLNKKGKLPIESKGISLELVSQLIDCGQLVTLDTNRLFGVIHNMTAVLTSEDYVKFLRIVLKDKDEVFRTEVINSRYKNSTLVKTILRVIEPTNNLMEFLKEHGVHYKNSHTMSALCLAIKYKRSENCITWLLENNEWDLEDIKKAANVNHCQPYVIKSIIYSKCAEKWNTLSWLNLVCQRSYLSSEYLDLAKHLIAKSLKSYNSSGEYGDYKAAIGCLTEGSCNQYSLQVFNLFQATIKNFTDSEDIKLCWFSKNSDIENISELQRQFFTHVKETSTTDSEGNTLLHLASRTNSIERIKLAYSWNPNINAMNNCQETPLHLLTREPNFCANSWKFFLDNNANVCAKDVKNNTPVSNLVKLNNESCVTAMLYLNEYNDIEELVVSFSGTKMSDENTNTLLHHAAKTHSLQLVDVLLKASYEVNAVNKNKQTPLHLVYQDSGEKFSLECWKLLVDNGANVLVFDDKEETPFCRLRNLSYDEVLPVILHVFTKFCQTSHSLIDSILWLTVKNFDLKVIKFVCELFKTNFQTSLNNVTTNITKNPSSILDAAMENINGEILEYVLMNLKSSTFLSKTPSQAVFMCMETKWFEKSQNFSFFSDPNFRVGRGTAVFNRLYPDLKKELHLKTQLIFIKVLATHYPDVLNTTNEEGQVPLSSPLCDERFVQPFVEQGANVNAKDVNDNTPLHWAIKNSGYNHAFKLIEQLIKFGADVNSVNTQQQTPLLLTLEFKCSQLDLICYLISENADPRKADSSGNNILHLFSTNSFCPKKSFAQVLRRILDKGYYDVVTSRNNSGFTPVDMVKIHNCAILNEISHILRSHNIEV